MEFGAYGGAGAVRSGGGTALDAVDAAPVFSDALEALKVLRRRPWLRRGREGLVGLSTVKNGAVTGGAVTSSSWPVPVTARIPLQGARARRPFAWRRRLCVNEIRR